MTPQQSWSPDGPQCRGDSKDRSRGYLELTAPEGCLHRVLPPGPME